jgi:hypothetical protein
VPAFEDKVTLQQPDLPFGTHVFNLTGPSDDPAKLKWMAVDLSADAVTDLGQDDAGAAQASALLYAATIRRVDVPEATAHRLAALLRPGTTMVITDKPVGADTYSAPGFTIMTTGDTYLPRSLRQFLRRRGGRPVRLPSLRLGNRSSAGRKRLV